MKKYFVALLILVVGITTSPAQENRSRLTVDPTIPLAGQPLTVTYDPAGGPLEGQGDIHALVHMFNNYRWETRTLELRRSEEIYSTTYRLPDDCAFVGFDFFIRGEYGHPAVRDNNDDAGFVYMVNSPAGGYMPGTALAWGIFRKPSLGKGITGYYDEFNISDDAVMMWIFREEQTFGQNLPLFFDSFIAAVRLASEEEFPLAVEEIVPYFLGMPRITEKSYIQVRDLYRFQLKDTVKADSVERIILEKYPRGEAARFIAHRNSQQDMNRDNIVEKLEGFLNEFPVEEWWAEPDQRNQEYMYYITYRALIEALMGTGQFDKARAYGDQMYFKALNETYRWNIEGHLKNPNENFTDRYPVADKYIRRMMETIGDGTMSDGSQSGISDRAARSQFATRLAAHIRILERMGKDDEAREFFGYMPSESRLRDPDLNDAYMAVLIRTAPEGELIEFLESTISANAATPAILQRLEDSYKKTHGSTEGYQAYIDGLKSYEDLEQIRAELLKHIIDVPYEHFSLENPDRNMVSSADWGDKVVIIDFWGTWCFPCIRAFPGMQMAVDKFADDPQAEFYFISTDDKLENVERFIDRNNYNFNWLYDLDTARNDSPGAVYKYFRELLDVSGVPCKLAVKDGRVRYVSVGYGGSPSKLADELTILIEILKEI